MHIFPLLLLLSATPPARAQNVQAVDPASYVGNVYGSVSDGAGSPLSEASVTVWHDGAAVRSASSDASGNFLINMIPTPFDGHDYAVVAYHPGYAPATIRNVRVLPGATMALEVAFRLARPRDGHDSEATWRYRHEQGDDPRDNLRLQSVTSDRDAASEAAPQTRTIFATREGLVGGTTANGHVIVTNDRFAALPSRRALAKNFGHEREVRVTYRGRSTVVPVWDIGPWNIHDDYWNPPIIRETFKDLPWGKPEAEAAFRTGYNGGLDERGRVVKTPAGIDLADGTFQIDLAVSPFNDYVEVEYLFLDSVGPVTGVPIVTTNAQAAPRTTFRVTATITDALTGSSPIDGSELFVDAAGPPGTGLPATAVDGVFDSPAEEVEITLDTTMWVPGTHTIFVHGRDAFGNWGPLTGAELIVFPHPRRRAAR